MYILISLKKKKKKKDCYHASQMTQFPISTPDKYFGKSNNLTGGRVQEMNKRLTVEGTRITRSERLVKGMFSIWQAVRYLLRIFSPFAHLSLPSNVHAHHVDAPPEGREGRAGDWSEKGGTEREREFRKWTNN